MFIQGRPGQPGPSGSSGKDGLPGNDGNPGVRGDIGPTVSCSYTFTGKYIFLSFHRELKEM